MRVRNRQRMCHSHEPGRCRHRGERIPSASPRHLDDRSAVGHGTTSHRNVAHPAAHRQQSGTANFNVFVSLY